jgi:hypothetical protein
MVIEAAFAGSATEVAVIVVVMFEDTEAGAS